MSFVAVKENKLFRTSYSEKYFLKKLILFLVITRKYFSCFRFSLKKFIFWHSMVALGQKMAIQNIIFLQKTISKIINLGNRL